MLTRRSTLLAFAFASLLLIIGAAAFAIWRETESAQREASALHEAHLRDGNALASIRANVFLGGILTRDYLLDPDASHADHYKEQFGEIRSEAEKSFDIIAASEQSSEERAALQRLRSDVNDYWASTQIVLDWTPEQKNAIRSAFLQERLRRREEIVSLAGQVEQQMTANFNRERERITSADDRFRASLAWTTVIALLLGVGIATTTVMHIANLELRSAAADAELRRLSAQIRMAQEQERRYLSRELHDQAGQMLTGLRMELASISHAAGAEEFSERVAHAKSVVEQTLRVVRNIAMMLRPSMLDDLGLVSAIGWLARDLTRSSGMEIRTAIDPAVDDLPDAECTCVYRVVQEALTNATKHSSARNVEIELAVREGEIRGSITDDGGGFETNGKPGSSRVGIGLLGMEERVRELGGTLRVLSSPGNGARIEFQFPFAANPVEEKAEIAVKA
jgi:signal transduction histidine kinase